VSHKHGDPRDDRGSPFFGGQLRSLIGILPGATIALSSATFLDNLMAGAMLKAMRNARPGDFITVAELIGHIGKMDLLHTEIQTESGTS
jgi:small-conductance mechanosensitive channel